MGGIGSCAICQRADVRAVDEHLKAGGGYRPVARILEVSHVTLREHWIRCRKKGEVDYQDGAAPVAIVPPSAAALSMPPTPPAHVDDDPVIAAIEQIRAAHEKAIVAYESAAKAGDMRAIALLLPQLRQNLDMRLKLLEKANPNAGERLRDNPDWQATLKFLLETLDSYPEAKAAVREGLLRLEAMEEKTP